MSTPRDDLVYIDDIQESIQHILDYTKGISERDLANDDLKLDAVIRRLLVIGEAVKCISQSTKDLDPSIPWQEIAGTRDVLVHEYKAIIPAQVWHIIEVDLPSLSKALVLLVPKLEAKLKSK